MGLQPILSLLSGFVVTCRALWLNVSFFGSMDPLSEGAAELVIKRATIKGTWK